MATYQVGEIAFHVSPVSIMQCWVGVGWSARGSAEEIGEFRTFTRQLFPFLVGQNCEDPIRQFCANAIAKMDQIITEEKLTTGYLNHFAGRIRDRLSVDNQRSATAFSEKYCEKLEAWLASPIGQCGARSASLVAEWGLAPPCRGLGAVGAFGNAVFGKYVNDLRAVCVQLDVISQYADPEVQFIETLLHEEIHASIHYAMGDDADRPELTWLNELCAVLTSQEAIRASARELLDSDGASRVADALGRTRSQQEYGALAEAVLQDTADPLVALKAWKRLFELPAAQRSNYARNSVITPILRDLGWQVSFPYHFGKKYITVFA